MQARRVSPSCLKTRGFRRAKSGNAQYGSKGAFSMTRAFHRTIVCPVFIGRQQNLTTLLGLLEQKRSGEGQAILLKGEAGIGKTRLVAEIKTTAVQQGFLLLEGQCFQ